MSLTRKSFLSLVPTALLGSKAVGKQDLVFITPTNKGEDRFVSRWPLESTLPTCASMDLVKEICDNCKDLKLNYKNLRKDILQGLDWTGRIVDRVWFRFKISINGDITPCIFAANETRGWAVVQAENPRWVELRENMWDMRHKYLSPMDIGTEIDKGRDLFIVNHRYPYIGSWPGKGIYTAVYEKLQGDVRIKVNPW